MPEQEFAGHKKVGSSILSGPENKLKYWAVPKIPGKIETYHLTLMTVVWTAVNVAVGFFAKENLALLWVVSLMILLQYLTDLFDGEVGRQRNTGLIKWGFYMDHFLDYLFLCSLVFVGYMISPAGLETWYVALLVMLGAFMVNSFLSFAATNQFEIYHFGVGPTESRMVFIIINTGIIYFGTDHFDILLPITILLCAAGLVIYTYQIQKMLWRLDMELKESSDDAPLER